MNFTQEISLINQQLDISNHTYITEPHLQTVCDYALSAGGKRIRPLLVLLFSRLWQGDDSIALKVGSALEFVHCYSLIHDDLPAMDNDDLRRGKPTLHKQYNEAIAILAGDALLTAAFGILSDAHTHPDSSVRCSLVQILSQQAGGKGGMIAGQYHDMLLSPFYTPNDIKAILAMQQAKTGALITASCLMGAVSAGVHDNHMLKKIKAYGHHIGLIFQLKDDLLDCESNESTLGKKTQKDDIQGKKTILSLLGVQATKAYLDSEYQKAVAILKAFPENDTQRSLLEITSYLKNRDY